MGLTLLMGGVTGEQFGKTCLALVNALIVSLAAVLVVCRDGNDIDQASPDQSRDCIRKIP